MAATNPVQVQLLVLPREIRDQIIGEVLFPEEKQPRDLTQNILGTASTSVRQIHPYDIDESKKPRFDISIITTCKQLQREAEEILYGSSSWNLMYQDWRDTEKVSYEFFEKFPRRLRQLIQRVERKCYSSPYPATISLWDWKAFMTFLARECPHLHSLRLWGPGDKNEGPAWVETCNRDAEWVQAILQIKSLKTFDIPVIPKGNIYTYPKFSDDFLPWLKASLIQAHKTQREGIQTFKPIEADAPFPLLRLDWTIRDRIYRHMLLPPDRRIHPYLKPWYDLTTRNTLSLLLTCRQIHSEAESVLYGTAIFTSPSFASFSRVNKYDRRLSLFLDGKIRETALSSGVQPRLLRMIKHLSFGWSRVGQVRFFNIIGNSMQLDYLEFVLPERGVDNINREWRERAVNPKALWRAGYAGDYTMQVYARIPSLVISTPEGKELEPECREWWTKGLRNELLYPSGDPKLAWLHKRAGRMLSSGFNESSGNRDQGDALQGCSRADVEVCTNGNEEVDESPFE